MTITITRKEVLITLCLVAAGLGYYWFQQRIEADTREWRELHDVMLELDDYDKVSEAEAHLVDAREKQSDHRQEMYRTTPASAEQITADMNASTSTPQGLSHSLPLAPYPSPFRVDYSLTTAPLNSH